MAWGRNKGGNGHGAAPQQGFNHQSVSDLERLWSQSEMPSVTKEFVRPGQSTRDLLMRCRFHDSNEAHAAVIFLQKCEEFGLSEYDEMLGNLLASSVSVGGLSRRELLQAATGIVVPSLYGRPPEQQRRSWDDKEGR